MTNNEKFNQLLNSCYAPRAVYSTLLILGVRIKAERNRHGGPEAQAGGQQKAAVNT